MTYDGCILHTYVLSQLLCRPIWNLLCTHSYLTPSSVPLSPYLLPHSPPGSYPTHPTPTPTHTATHTVDVGAYKHTHTNTYMWYLMKCFLSELK